MNISLPKGWTSVVGVWSVVLNQTLSALVWGHLLGGKWPPALEIICIQVIHVPLEHRVISCEVPFPSTVILQTSRPLHGCFLTFPSTGTEGASR